LRLRAGLVSLQEQLDVTLTRELGPAPALPLLPQAANTTAVPIPQSGAFSPAAPSAPPELAVPSAPMDYAPQNQHHFSGPIYSPVDTSPSAPSW